MRLGKVEALDQREPRVCKVHWGYLGKMVLRETRDQLARKDYQGSRVRLVPLVRKACRALPALQAQWGQRGQPGREGSPLQSFRTMSSVLAPTLTQVDCSHLRSRVSRQALPAR